MKFSQILTTKEYPYVEWPSAKKKTRIKYKTNPFPVLPGPASQGGTTGVLGIRGVCWGLALCCGTVLTTFGESELPWNPAPI